MFIKKCFCLYVCLRRLGQFVTAKWGSVRHSVPLCTCCPAETHRAAGTGVWRGEVWHHPPNNYGWCYTMDTTEAFLVFCLPTGISHANCWQRFIAVCIRCGIASWLARTWSSSRLARHRENAEYVFITNCIISITDWTFLASGMSLFCFKGSKHVNWLNFFWSSFPLPHVWPKSLSFFCGTKDVEEMHWMANKEK